jgi:hypothetical protein
MRFKIVEIDLLDNVIRTYYEARTIKSAQRKLRALTKPGDISGRNNISIRKSGIVDKKTGKLYHGTIFDVIEDEEELATLYGSPFNYF